MPKAITPIVETSTGKIEGAERQGLFIFRGVPYAAPPVGGRRWLPPQPLKPWNGIRPAKEYASIAPQVVQPGGFWTVVPEPQNEDCLYLNIWTPGLDNAKRPVLVWIHGGAFVEGSGSQSGYRGHVLANRGNAVIVSINYRLGSLGFLSLKAVTEGRIPNTGNEGLLDQAAALEWVKENIVTFGGDPHNITIFGESAGGMSVGCQLAMPGSKGLFHKAILQSGATSNAQPMEMKNRVAELFLETLRLRGNDIKGLYALSSEQMMEAQKQLTLKVRTNKLGINTMPFQPGIDGGVIPLQPLQAVKLGASGEIPIIVGTTLDEWRLFGAMDPAVATLSDEDLKTRLLSQIPLEDIPKVIETYRKARNERGLSASNSDIFTAIQTDLVFRLPAIRLAEAKQNQRQPAYHYIFTWPSPVMNGKLGACHAIDVPFTWGTLEPVFSGTGPKADAVSQHIQDAWLAMARTGNPSCETLGWWPPYGSERATMMLGEKYEVIKDPLAEERQVWEKIRDKVRGNF